MRTDFQSTTLTPSQRRVSGFTLLEVAIALLLLSIITVAIGSLLGSTNDAVAEMTSNVHDEQSLRRALNRLYDDVKTSAVSRVTIDKDTSNDTLTLQTADPSGSGDWGAIGGDGLFRVNHFVRYQAVNGQVTRSILDAVGDPLSSPGAQVILSNANSGGVQGAEKGLEATLNGSVLLLELSTIKTLQGSKHLKSFKKTSVFIPST